MHARSHMVFVRWRDAYGHTDNRPYICLRHLWALETQARVEAFTVPPSIQPPYPPWNRRMHASPGGETPAYASHPWAPWQGSTPHTLSAQAALSRDVFLTFSDSSQLKRLVLRAFLARAWPGRSGPRKKRKLGKNPPLTPLPEPYLPLRRALFAP